MDNKRKVRVCVTASKMTLNLKCLRHPVAKLLTRDNDKGTFIRSAACYDMSRSSVVLMMSTGEIKSLGVINIYNHLTVGLVSWSL